MPGSRTLTTRKIYAIPNLYLILFQFICHTDVDQGGLAKAYKWGWCGEGCPLEHVNTTWGTDETLTVTTEVVRKIDPDIYKAMIGLVILAIALVIMAGLVRFWGNVILLIIWIKSFLKYLFYCRKLYNRQLFNISFNVAFFA